MKKNIQKKLIFVYYNCCQNVTTEPTSCHAGSHWYNRTQSTSHHHITWRKRMQA